MTIATDGRYVAVRMRVVAERAGIAVGTLYRYFPSKAHLLVAVLTREFEHLDADCNWATTADGASARKTQRSTALRMAK